MTTINDLKESISICKHQIKEIKKSKVFDTKDKASLIFPLQQVIDVNRKLISSEKFFSDQEKKGLILGWVKKEMQTA